MNVPSDSSRTKPVAVITGAASGIGKETAQRLAATHRVALLDRNEDRLRALVAHIDGETAGVLCDVSDQKSVDAAVRSVVERFGRIDVAISNAGIGTAGVARHLHPDALAQQLDVNLTGNWRFIHACLPHLEQTRGCVLGVASAAAIMGPPGEAFYAASKAGLEALLDTVRVEVAHLGIDVGVAYLMFIDTPLVQEGDVDHPDLAALRSALTGPAGRTYPVAAAADAFVKAVEHRSAQVFVPGSLRIQHVVRGVMRRVLDRKLRTMAPELDRLTKEKVADRGAYDAAFGARERLARPRSRAHGR